MSPGAGYWWKRAETPGEIEQIHELNHRTFVEEIRQQPDGGGRRLVDRFHEKNRYFIALRGARVVGMVSVNDRPPFSIEERLPDPEALEGRALGESRCRRSAGTASILNASSGYRPIVRTTRKRALPLIMRS
jgi:hypothetical protein